MSKFLSNMLKLSSSTLVGQILGLIATPILARIYSPSDFGIFQIFLSIVSLIAPLACFSYYYAIVLPEKKEDAANVVILCLSLITIISFITTLCFFLFSGTIEKELNAPTLSRYLPLLPFAIIFSGYAYVLGFWISRQEQYNALASANVVSSFTGKGFSIGYGILKSTPFGLILGSMINDATIAIMLLKKISEDFSLFYHTSFQKIKKLMIYYKKFPQYSFGSDLAANVVIQFIPFLLALNFSPEIVGYYAMSYIALRLPSKLVGTSIGTVFFQQACLEKNLTGGIKNVVKAVLKRLISFGIFICLILVIAGPVIFSFVLGTRWATAGQYAQILAPSFFMSFVSIPLYYIYQVLGKQAVTLWFNLSLLVLSASALIIGGVMHSPIMSMILLSLAGTALGGWMNIYSLNIAEVSWRDMLYDIGYYLLFGSIVCIPLFVAMLLSLSSVIIMIIIVIVSVVYYAVILYQDISLRNGLLKFVNRIISK
ncbi:lipopolysaccharide biosynthesis protein [Methanoregula sp.]|uniref:lipopolysaccharide biosynthesis protein n=1 Tax=Methanoregula sp. TaxID=2052170 RepID=UPI003BB20812